MEKLARKPSADPVQEKLRQNKALWNKDVSAFVNDLIHFKKMMNGWPSKFFPERSKIVEPIPADPATIIGSLAGDFQEIAQRANSIIQEQVEYSKTRRKRQPKQLNLPLPQPQSGGAPVSEPPKPDLSQQLNLPNVASTESDLVKLASSLEDKYALVSEASTPISRFFARLLNPSFGFGEAARVRRVRMQLLNACANLYKKLNRLQVEVVKSSDKSIDSTYQIAQDAWREWETVRIGFNTYKGMMPPKVPDAGGVLEPPKEVEKIKEQEAKDAARVEKSEEKLEEKEEKKSESDKVNQQMDKINRSIENGKPDPEDFEYENHSPTEEEFSPDWVGAKESLTDDMHEQQNLRLAAWAKSDLLYALRNTLLLSEHGIDVKVFENLIEYVRRFSIRSKWAPMVVETHRDILDTLNDQLGTMERSFKDIIWVLNENDRANERMEKERQKVEKTQLKEQEKQERINQKEEEARRKAEIKAQEKAKAEQRKEQQRVDREAQKEQQRVQREQEQALKNQEKQQKILERERQKALLNVPAPSSTASDESYQLEAVAQKFLQKWIGKTRHQMSMFDQTSSQRLQIFEVADEMRKTVDQVMDHLEKDIQIETLEPMVAKVNKQISTVRSLIRNLHALRKPKK